MPIDQYDTARALRHREAVNRRHDMLVDAHMAPLKKFVLELRSGQGGTEFPHFDPLDGGIHADILFLLEKPGPMTSSAGTGSGFISRNNNDPTAEATFKFMNEACIPRHRTITWNVVPGWNGTRKVTTAELKAGVHHLKQLLLLLPNLTTVVLVGRRAQRARSLIEHLDLRIYESAHPSPIVRASRRKDWDAIPGIWARTITNN